MNDLDKIWDVTMKPGLNIKYSCDADPHGELYCYKFNDGDKEVRSYCRRSIQRIGGRLSEAYRYELEVDGEYIYPEKTQTNMIKNMFHNLGITYTKNMKKK